MMTMIMSDNTNTYTNTGDHEQQMAGLEIHHVSSPWHNRHITTSLLSTVCSPCLTVYPLHPLLHPHLILMVRSLTFFSLFFFFFFFFTNHLEHQVHSHHPTPSSLSMPPVNTQPYRLETCLHLEPKIFLSFFLFFFSIYIVLKFI